MSTEVKKEMEKVGAEAVPTQKEIQEQNKRNALMQKQAALDLAAYKKRLRESVELKRLQVEELELNIHYFEVNKAWEDLQPEVEAYEAQKKAEHQKQQEEYEKMIKDANEKNADGGSMPIPNNKDTDADPQKIEIAKVGEPRKPAKKKS